jgi:hypothetical protein
VKEGGSGRPLFLVAGGYFWQTQCENVQMQLLTQGPSWQLLLIPFGEQAVP